MIIELGVLRKAYSSSNALHYQHEHKNNKTINDIRLIHFSFDKRMFHMHVFQDV